MSFQPIQPYPRPILQPISVPTQKSVALGPRHQLAHPIPRSTGTAWTATIHSFLGNPRREVTLLWPPEKFDEDPARIADDPNYNKHYDATSARPSHEPGVYRMYQSMDEQSPKGLADIAPPRLVVKRYLPSLPPASKDTAKPALTLLMLPGMGLPKEVNDATYRSSTVLFTYTESLGLRAHDRNHLLKTARSWLSRC